MQWYKHFPGDYARDTPHLTLEQHGAYRLLLDFYYASGKPLPPDIETLSAICKTQTVSGKKAIGFIADTFFPLNGDGLRHNKRADLELEKAKTRAEINKQVGKLGGRPRKTHEVSRNNPNQNQILKALEVESPTRGNGEDQNLFKKLLDRPQIKPPDEDKARRIAAAMAAENPTLAKQIRDESP